MQHPASIQRRVLHSCGMYELEAAVVETMQCSFSLPDLIKTNPALTPSWGISANLLLITDHGGGIVFVYVRSDGGEGVGKFLEQHLATL